MASLLLLSLLLWLPGTLLRRVFGVAGMGGMARTRWGMGALAVDASLSLGFLSLLLLPLYLLQASLLLAPVVVWLALVALLVASLRRLVARQRDDRGLQLFCSPPAAAEVVAFLVAVALLLPVTLAVAGANVDDWWDLSFVRGWLAEGHFSFSQMALSPDQATQSSPWHPRFLWSVWLSLQALVLFVTGEEPWRMQAGPLAALCCVLTVSAQAALAQAVFRRCALSSAVVPATILATAAWIWGTEAFPLFVRGYQDKLVAGFILAPVLLALVIEALREQTSGRGLRHPALAVAAAALACVSVHSLVYTMALFVAALLLLVELRRASFDWLRRNPAVALALLLPALYPLAQALVLATIFGDQGVSLAQPGNPVVRAHLSLNRLFGTSTPAWIVHPGAVFGSIALLLPVALVVVAFLRRRGDGTRALVAMLLPALLLFVPGLASLAGKLWVPWMLYRFGWLLPLAPLLAYAFVLLWTRAREHGRRPVAAAVFATVLVLLAYDTAQDRLRRNMNEHPGPSPGAPVAAAASVYDFLARQPGRSAVLAPPNFSELLPAMSGKPVVAFPERGTLVFAGDELRAYERLRDRGDFFAAATSAAGRDRIAANYGAAWAVLPRRLVASGSEEAYVWRFGPEAFVAARAADEANDQACTGELCRGWWSATRESALARLPRWWRIVHETRDYFVVERGRPGETDAPARSTEAQEASSLAAAKDASATRWLRPFGVAEVRTGGDRRPEGLDLLATATSSPGALLHYDPPPQFALPSVSPIWLDGPGAWEDVPAEASLTFDLGAGCVVSAVELLPHLPRERRDVLEIRVDGRIEKRAAKHGAVILVELADAAPRRTLALHFRSLLGSAVSLADVRLLGRRGDCEAGWPKHQQPQSPQMNPGAGGLVALASKLPGSGRPLVSLARRASAERRDEVAKSLLEEATRREPELVEAWLELGFVGQALAAQHPEDAQLAEASREAFEGAVRADSRSAWARGSLAWSERLAGRAPFAIWHALAAAQIDPLYGDAWTILAYALGDLGRSGLAERALGVAERDDPNRNWPALARADLAVKRGDFAGARRALRDWLKGHPYDRAARDKLSAVASAEAAAGGGIERRGAPSGDAEAAR